MSTTAIPYRWEDLEQDHPMEKLDRRRIIGERVMLSDVLLHRGCVVPTHAHENEQFALVVSGKIRFRIGVEGAEQKELVLGAGEVLHLPSNVPHAAEALEDTRVLDVFSPISEGTGIDRVGRG
jgi:quercetin dioxygenase-like cupin family protein